MLFWREFFKINVRNRNKKYIYLPFFCLAANLPESILKSPERKEAFTKYPNGTEVPDKYLKRGLKMWNGDYNEICEICDEGGNIILCDFCNLVFHPECLNPPMKKIPDGHWACPECSADVEKIMNAPSPKRPTRGGSDSQAKKRRKVSEEEEEEDDDEEVVEEEEDEDDYESPKKEEKKPKKSRKTEKEDKKKDKNEEKKEDKEKKEEKPTEEKK